MIQFRTRAVSALTFLCLAGAVLSCDRTPTRPGAADVRTIRLEPAQDSLYPGAIRTLRATALDRSGHAIAGVALTWSSSDTAVATVDSAGVVSARKLGEARIRAVAGAASAEATLFVVPASATCQQGGTVHDGDAGSTTWRAVDSPHRVTVSVSIAKLTIEAGALVCFSWGTTLMVSSGGVLDVQGTTRLPVVLTAADTTKPWAGISGAGTILLRHALLESASSGVTGTGTVQIDSSHIRQIHQVGGGRTVESGLAVMMLSGRILASTIDSVDSGIYPGGFSANLTVEQSTLRGVGSGTGVYCRRSGSVSLRGTHIEGFATGLEFERYTGDCTLRDATGARLTRNGISAKVPLNAANVLFAQAGVDSLRGNASDTLQVFGGASGDIVIPGGIPVVGRELVFGGSGALSLLPGASLTLYTDGWTFALGIGQRLIALGTAAAPITLIGIRQLGAAPPEEMGGGAGAPSLLSHVEVRGLHVVASAGRPLLVDSSHFSAGASLTLRAVGSQVMGTLVEDAGDSAAVVLGADSVFMRQSAVRRSSGAGVRIDGIGVVVDSCDISGSTSDGVLVLRGAGVRVNHCNLAGNVAAGLENLGADTVDARLDWWGDATGPTAPGAARVVGPANFTPWATSPITIAPPSLTAARWR